jgi:hypothetical protein
MLPRKLTQFALHHKTTVVYNKEKLVLLAAFKTKYQDALTPLTTNMVPIIIDMEVSVSITP